MSDEESKQEHENNLTDLINLASSILASLSEEAKDYLFALAGDGSLEQYQSRGHIELWATELLKKLRVGGSQNTT